MPDPNQPQHKYVPSQRGKRRVPLTLPSPPTGGEGIGIPVRSLVAFFALFLLFFLVFLLLWTPCAGGYGWLFRTSGNILVGQGSQGRVWFGRPDNADGQHDVQIAVIDSADRVQRTTEVSSRRHGYMPTIFLMALILANPVPWMRRLWWCLWGLLWVNLYVAIKITLFPVAYGGDSVGAATLAGVLRWVLWVVGASSVGWMLVPLLIWAILTFRALFRPRRDTSS